MRHERKFDGRCEIVRFALTADLHGCSLLSHLQSVLLCKPLPALAPLSRMADIRRDLSGSFVQPARPRLKRHFTRRRLHQSRDFRPVRKAEAYNDEVAEGASSAFSHRWRGFVRRLRVGRYPRGDAGASPQREIRFSEGDLRWATETWKRQWQKNPSREELRGLVRDLLNEELLAREAREMGLDTNDKVVRRRLAQKMTFLIKDTSRLAEPTEDQLRQSMKLTPKNSAVKPGCHSCNCSSTTRHDQAQRQMRGRRSWSWQAQPTQSLWLRRAINC